MTEALEAIQELPVDAGTVQTEETAQNEPEAALSAEPTREAVETAKEEPQAQWPEDWREQLAGGDEALLKQLKRYSSPKTFAKGFAERESLIRSGKLKQVKPDASDEKAMAEWRKENGIPDDPTGYAVPEEIQKALTDGDKPIVSAWFEEAHSAGFNQEQAQKGLEWYAKTLNALEEQRAQQDTLAHDKCEDFLRKEWSHAEFKANNQLATRFLSDTPLGPKWAELRDPETGMRLGDSPEFIMWAADQGRQSFGDVSFATGDSERKFADRKAEIERIRDTDFERYDNDKALRQEYNQILEAELKRAQATRR